MDSPIKSANDEGEMWESDKGENRNDLNATDWPALLSVQ